MRRTRIIHRSTQPTYICGFFSPTHVIHLSVSRRTGFFNAVNPRDTYAEKMLREASVNRDENRLPKSNLAMKRTYSA